MERRWRIPQLVYKKRSLITEKMDHYYETKLGGKINIYNTAFTIIIIMST